MHKKYKEEKEEARYFRMMFDVTSRSVSDLYKTVAYILSASLIISVCIAQLDMVSLKPRLVTTIDKSVAGVPSARPFVDGSEVGAASPMNKLVESNPRFVARTPNKDEKCRNLKYDPKTGSLSCWQTSHKSSHHLMKKRQDNQISAQMSWLEVMLNSLASSLDSNVIKIRPTENQQESLANRAYKTRLLQSPRDSIDVDFLSKPTEKADAAYSDNSGAQEMRLRESNGVDQGQQTGSQNVRNARQTASSECFVFCPKGHVDNFDGKLEVAPREPLRGDYLVFNESSGYSIEPHHNEPEQYAFFDNRLIRMANRSSEKLSCERRNLIYKAITKDEEGNKCWGDIVISVCHGRCQSGEYPDWNRFLHKKPVHTVCTHGERVRQEIMLPECDKDLSSDHPLRYYSYLNAVTCQCSICSKTEATCMGTLKTPHLSGLIEDLEQST